MLHVLDMLLHVFHLALIGFNLTGWIWARTRKIHLVTIAATGFSWFILGLRYGLGYCPCTDWQWQIKLKLGETRLPASYVKYILDRLTGFDVSPAFADWLTGLSFGAAVLLSVTLNLRDWRRKLRQTHVTARH